MNSILAALLLTITLTLVQNVYGERIEMNGTSTSVLVPPQNNFRKLYETTERKLKMVWERIKDLGQQEGTFVGRCFGVARKLKMMMPLIIFKLGVIVTILGFLTIFSLKSLALLVGLVIMNVSSFTAKLALFKSDHGDHEKPPKNVHFHIHPSPHGHYNDGHPWEHSSPWDRKESYPKTGPENSELYNLYNKLANNPYSSSSSVYTDR